VRGANSSADPVAGVVQFAMDLSIRPLKTEEDAAAFRALNEEWITSP
jgi:hypothetical protein